MTEKKKNNQPYIIPPSYFKEKGILSKTILESSEGLLTDTSQETKLSDPSLQESHSTPQAIPPDTTATVANKEAVPEKNTANTTTKQPTNSNTPSPITPNIRRASGLSLNSIKKKKIHEAQKTEKILDPENLPTEEFTESQLQNAWQEYGKRQDKKGERILGSMLAMNIPSLKDGKIYLELPNGSMKIDMETAKAALLHYLSEKLNNYELNMVITVNETVAKKHAFTPLDKYEKLRDKNPLIDKLRALFDLDI